ncbi:MAG: hypothetical protein JNL42_14620 [Anaerolineae bacterium]|nr:hypothetical protein [Anaerolineae bacterium]
MQISRHWRLKAKRYRLEGVRCGNGDLRLQNRPASAVEEQPTLVTFQPQAVRVPVKA